MTYVIILLISWFGFHAISSLIEVYIIGIIIRIS